LNKENKKGRINKLLVEQANQKQKWRKKFKKQDCRVAWLKSCNSL